MNEWQSIDNYNEEKIIKIGNNKIRFSRPINTKTYSLSCPICDSVIGNIDDMFMLKQENCCNECYLSYYYQNKVRWEKGWRPEVNNK